MALLHQAELRPSKLELLEGWVPNQPWFVGEANTALSSVAAFRFDDPDGEVGVETILVRAGTGPILHVPLTYRGAPLEGGEEFLIGTMGHSVLGSRWVYDGVGDPVYLQAVATVTINGGHQAEMYVEIDGKRVDREPSALVSGSGTGRDSIRLPTVGELEVRQDGDLTLIDTSAMQFCVKRVMNSDEILTTGSSSVSYRTAETLTGTWDGTSEPQPLVVTRHN